MQAKMEVNQVVKQLAQCNIGKAKNKLDLLNFYDRNDNDSESEFRVYLTY